MLNYTEVKLGEKLLRIRIRMRDHAELDKLCDGDFFKALYDEEQGVLDIWRMLKNMLYVGSRAFAEQNGELSMEDIGDLLDAAVDSGWDVSQAAQCMFDICKDCGFFPRQPDMDTERLPKDPAQDAAATA